VVRDVALAVSGRLSRRIGGPGVHPPQPEGVYAFTQRKASWPTSQGADRFRRGLYTFFMRSAPYPALSTFDAPNFNNACTRRVRSNTPLQSLTLANDHAHFELAQAFAQRLLGLPCSDDRQRLARGFRLALGRPPSDQELDRLQDYLQQQRRAFELTPEDARRIAPAGLDADLSPLDAAAWTCAARVLMNLDEFITRG
jgi:hypothetical protein